MCLSVDEWLHARDMASDVEKPIDAVLRGETEVSTKEKNEAKRGKRSRVREARKSFEG